MSGGVVIVGAARTPIGAFLGGLAPLAATKLGAVAIKCALERAGVRPDQVDEVFMGNVIQAGVGQAPARQAALGAGIPNSVPCTTVNKVCGSGLKSVMLATSQIAAGEARLIVAGGMESMSNAPYLLRGARTGLPLGEHRMEDANIVDGLQDAYGHGHMGLGGELAADRCGLSRAEQDRFALASYDKALRAQREGAFDEEIAPVDVPGRKGAITVVSRDETPRETTLDSLAKLAPVFKRDGTVTAGNASKLNDGAAAVVVAHAERASALGLSPLARVVAQAQYAHEPEMFLVAPRGAIARCLEKAGWSVGDVDLFEVNEAFSGIECVRRELDIPAERFNVNGGAVALGHPLGCTGAKLTAQVLSELRRRQGRYGLVTMCVGGGMGAAGILERM